MFQLWRSLISIILQCISFLCVSYLSITMGFCHNRYPARIFSATNPPSSLPEYYRELPVKNTKPLPIKLSNYLKISFF